MSSSVRPLREEPESDAPREERSSGGGAAYAPPASRRRVKPTSLWFCANESCDFHDHQTPLAANDARSPRPGVLHCPQCNADTLVPANEYNLLPPWYDHETIRKHLNRPVEPTFPTG